ncbi:hypothetical protein [Bifidobacterium longum]|uniref:hypothetical protein n=1 Tax=Bifidobacterium longum TaxID=216816 RepID=UPI001899178A|nr:hypothetical protein [Bifidobacterium longum]MDB6735109.1 hypothetical protein [Bifidobacterium longum]
MVFFIEPGVGVDGESITTIGMSIDWKETRLQKSNVIVRNSLMVKRILGRKMKRNKILGLLGVPIFLIG